MKWKDGSETTDQEEIQKEEYFDEEQYSPWAKKTETANGGPLKKIPTVFLLLCLAIVTCVAALLILLFSGRAGTSPENQVNALEARVQQLEDRLDKYEAIDEKVTRIWEQAKSFEKFKDRFDRTEASMSLRMDHLTMSLENLQKQSSRSKQAPVQNLENIQKYLIKPNGSPEVPSEPQAPATEQPPAQNDAQQTQYHTIVKGDTVYSISRKYNLPVEALLKMNNLDKDDVMNLKVGQKLIVRESNEAQ